VEPTDIQQAATGQTVEAPSTPGQVPDLEDASLYFNRELSWLDFNERVLELAEDVSVPLLERLRFAAIWESNLDEFFMVRVATLHDQIEAGMDARAADGMGASEQLDAVHERVASQRARMASCVARELRPALSEHGIRLVSVDDPDRAAQDELARLFEGQIFPTLTPLVLGSSVHSPTSPTFR